MHSLARCVVVIYFNLLSFVHLIDLPTINLESVGQLGFIGDYAGLSPFKSQRQFESVESGILLSNNNQQHPIYELLYPIQGTIETSCQLRENIILLGGDFEYHTKDGQIIRNIVQLDMSTLELSPLTNNTNLEDGSVYAMYCQDNMAYVGGTFNNSALLYQNNQWFDLPWKGFNGPVYTIVKNPYTNSILFGGQFDSTGDGQFFNRKTSQSVNLATSAIFSSGNGALSGNNSNPSSLVCSQDPWLLQDGVPGYWEALFTSTIKPSIFRLSNTHLEGRNTDEFNIMALGSNEYFELTYNDPITNEVVVCTEHCYLSNDSNIAYQDFTVTTPLAAKALRININSWDGDGGGLGGIEIFRSDVALQPQLDANNNISCSDTSKSSITTATGGNWTEKFNYGNYQDFLFNTLSPNDILTQNPTVSYQPFIASQGVYDIYVNTPGCVGTSSCHERTKVDLSLELVPGNQTSIELDQRVSTDTRQLIYSGMVAATTDRFKPSITLRPIINTLSNSMVSISADSIEFVRNANGSTLTSILDYYPSENKWMPLLEQLPLKSVVKTIQPSGDKLYIGGQFKSVNGTFSNLISYQYNKGFQSLAESGLNGNVTTSLLFGTKLYVGGHFNNTLNGSHTGLNNIAMYDIQSNIWSNLDQGLDDSVTKLLLINDNTLHISGQFNSTGPNKPAFNNIQWDISNSNWIEPNQLIVGPISTIIKLPNDDTIYAGHIKSGQSYRASDASSLLDTNSLDTLISRVDPNATVTAGVFWKNVTMTEKKDGDLVTILGGTFHLDNAVYRIVIHSQGVWKGHLKDVQGDIHTMTVVNNHLCIGGQFKGVYQKVNITSFAMFDLLKQRVININGIFDSKKEPGLVNVIRAQPNGKQIYVGGHFSYAGFLNCEAICTFSTMTHQWTQANQGIQGTITDMTLQNNEKITVIGDLVVQSTHTHMAYLNSENAPWIAVTSNDHLGQPTLLLKNENNELLVAGRNDTSAFLGSWNGQRLELMKTNLGSSSHLDQLLFIPIHWSYDHPGSYPSGTNTMLMAVGHLDLPTFGNASAALFDGSQWYPFLLSSNAQGQPGSIRQMLTESDCCTIDKIHHYLSVPAVILISIAISLGMIFCMASLGFLFVAFKRKKDDQMMNTYSGNNALNVNDPAMAAYLKPRYTPTSFSALLDSVVQINTPSSPPVPPPPSKLILPAAGFSTAVVKKESGSTNKLSNQSSNVESLQRRSSSQAMTLPSVTGPTFSTLVAMALANSSNQHPASDDMPHIYYSKYPFEAKEFGELSFDANVTIVVTDMSDNVWWMGYKDDGAGNPVSGLFPSNYVTKTKP